MKKYLIKTTLLFAIFAILFSCKKEEVPLFKQDPGVYFMDGVWSYSFIDRVGVTIDTLKLSTRVFGKVENYDREFTAKEIEDDTSRITTLPTASYEILKGVVLAGKEKGILYVKVKYAPEMDDSIFNLCLEITPNEHFTNLAYNKKKLKIDVTNKIVPPANWRYISYYFGKDFSTRWWKFIMEATGKSSIPYNPYHEDKETWWMSDVEMIANSQLVQHKLEQYNELHPNEPLTHDDGVKAGQPVIM